MVFVLGILFFNQAKYTEAAALAGLVDEIGSRFSEAQAYGIAVKQREAGSSDFSSAYGMSFTLLELGGQYAYMVFSDRNTNDYYDSNLLCIPGGAQECVEKINITRGNYLDSICVVNSNGNTTTCTAVKRADINFRRPAPAARITAFNSSGNAFSPASMAGLKFIFKSPSGLTRSVSVYMNGQFSIQ